MFGKKRDLPSIRLLRQSVGDVLATRENRLILIESQILLLIFVALYVVLTQTFSVLGSMPAVLSSIALTYLLFAVYVLLLAAVTAFLMLPTVIGFLRMASEMERGGAVVPSDLFAVFSDGVLYRRSLGMSWRILWRVVLIVTVVDTTVSLSTYFFAGSLIAGLICGVIVLLELIGGVWLILHGFSLLADVFAFHLTLSEARRAVKGGYRIGVHFFAGFLLWILLGILSFGVLLLWEVVPCMAVGYFRYCRELKDQNLNIHSEEYKHE